MKIASYNVENLFDLYKSGNEYKEYIPNTKSNWNQRTYKIKLKNIAKVIVEIDADIMLKATKVDGIYDSDPETNPDAKFIPEITYQEALEKRLKVMDATALSLCMDNDIPLVVFKLDEPGNILKAINGEAVGTRVYQN